MTCRETCPDCNAKLETCDIANGGVRNAVHSPTYCSNCDICFACDNRISELHLDGCRCDDCQNRNEAAAERAQGDAWAGGFAENH